MKGKLIVFEGLDKSGKETQSQLLADYLNKIGIKTALMSFPDYESDTGYFIRRYLDGKEKEVSQETVNLMYSANRYAKRHWIRYVLGVGAYVILDRYYYSNMAYGATTIHDMEKVRELDSEMPKPDLIVMMDITPEESVNRSGKSADINERDIEFLSQVRKRYHWIFHHTNNSIMVNGDQEREMTHDQIVAMVEDRLFKQ